MDKSQIEVKMPVYTYEAIVRELEELTNFKKMVSRCCGFTVSQEVLTEWDADKEAYVFDGTLYVNTDKLKDVLKSISVSDRRGNSGTEGQNCYPRDARELSFKFSGASYIEYDSALIESLTDVLNVLQNNTQPCDGHTDPKSINDCWATVFDILRELEVNK